jgi:ADP-ribose pyrophosphatase
MAQMSVMWNYCQLVQMSRGTAMKVIDLEVAHCQLWGEGGFSQLRRCRVRNLRADGSHSRTYLLDLVERPGRTDAVAVLPYERRPGMPERVLLRRGLRPALRLGRAGQPTREGETPSLMHLETVAGILEPGDLGEEGLRRRAAAELLEEAGIEVSPSEIHALGPPVFLSPGLMAERIYFSCVEVALDRRGEPTGDGSQLEEGGEVVIWELDRALDLCSAGGIQDVKAEVALRRLREHLNQGAG